MKPDDVIPRCRVCWRVMKFSDPPAEFGGTAGFVCPMFCDQGGDTA